MSTDIKQSKALSKAIDPQRQSEDLDLRLKRQIYLCSQLQNQLSLVKAQTEYCSSFLQTLKEEHEKMKKHYLFSKNSPFGGWESKLKQLSISAISNESFSQSQSQLKSQVKEAKKAQCSQKAHLSQILSEKSRQVQSEEISFLESKLTSLYEQISNMVAQQYLNDKIFQRIKRQARKQSKQKTLAFLDKQISKYRHWAEQNRCKVQNQMNSKEIEEKVVHNLELMKLIMNKKVINNDYVFEQFEEKREENMRKIDKIEELQQKIMEKYQSSTAFFKDKQVERLSQRKDLVFPSKQGNDCEQPLNFKQIQAYFNKVDQTMSCLDIYGPQAEISSQCKLLSKKLDQLQQSLKR